MSRRGFGQGQTLALVPGAILLIVLIVFFAISNAWIVGKTDRLQQQVEDRHSELASRAGDALGNIHLIQSFVRLGAEAGPAEDHFRDDRAAEQAAELQTEGRQHR